MSKILMAALCCVALAACSSMSGSKQPSANSGSSNPPAATNTTPPAATNTEPNANQGEMHNTDTGNPTISNKPTTGY
jgi:uncharacterized lipoprotein